MKQFGTVLALIAILATSTPPTVQAHSVCITACTVAITDQSVQYALIPYPSWDCITVQSSWSWTGLCLLGDGTNCNDFVGSTLVVSLPGGMNTSWREVGNVNIACINGHSDQAYIILPPGINAATYRFKGSCSTNSCHVSVIASYDCPMAAGTNAPPAE